MELRLRVADGMTKTHVCVHMPHTHMHTHTHTHTLAYLIKEICRMVVSKGKENALDERAY